MKKFDLVKLIDATKYLERGLYKDLHGVVLNIGINESEILFVNETNIGEAIIVKVSNKDLIIEKEKLPEYIIDEIQEKLDINKLMKKTNLK